MANSQVQLRKPTLDKDLEKLTFTEQATHFVLRSWTGVGISLVFLLIAMAVAKSFATGTPGILVIAISAALAAVLPTARKPPVQVAFEGISPRWPQTGMPSSRMRRIVCRLAAQ